MFGDLLAGDRLDFDFERRLRRSAPASAGSSTVWVSPAPMLSIVALRSCCRSTVTETVTPFSVDSPWFWTSTSTSGVSSAATAVVESATSAVPLMLVPSRPSPWTPSVSPPARAADRAERRADRGLVEPLRSFGQEDALRDVVAFDPVVGEHAVDFGPHHGRVEDVAGEQLLHLVGDRRRRLLGRRRRRARCSSCSAISVHRAAAQLVDEFERALRVAHVAGGAEAVDAAGVVVHRAAVGVDLGDELGHREVRRVRRACRRSPCWSVRSLRRSG